MEPKSTYRRALLFGANWTMVVPGVYLILSAVAIFAVGGFAVLSGDIPSALELAGKSPAVFGAVVMLDGVFHILFLISAVTLYMALRGSWPVRAALILACGFWQMIVGFTKGLSSLLMFTPIGSAYVVGDAATRATLTAVGSGFYGLRLALQTMDGFGILVIVIILSLLPAGSMPRSIRWLGWAITIALLSATPSGPTFILVIILFPVWAFLVGRWLKTQLPA